MKSLMTYIAIVLFVASVSMAEAASQQAKLTWPDVTGVDQETGYDINMKVGSTGTYAPAGSVGANVLTLTVPNLVQGTNYCFQVIAKNAVGSGIPSDDACIVSAGKPGKVGPVTVIIELVP